MASKEDENDAVPTHLDGEVTLVTEDVRFVCRRRSLADASGYFSAMFNSNMVESGADVITLKAVTPQHLETLVDFASSGTFACPARDGLLEFLSAACMLNFEAVVDACVAVLLREVNVATCLSVYHVAESHALGELAHRTRNHATWYFEQVIRGEEFLELPVHSLVTYLSSQDLNVTSELSIFTALETWVKHDLEHRISHLPELMTCLNLSSLSRDELDHVISSLATREAADSTRKAQETLDALCKDSSPNNDSFTDNKSPRPCRQFPRVLCVIGGSILSDSQEEKPHAYLLHYQSDQNSFKELSAIPSYKEGDVWGCKACLLGKDLYVTGGETTNALGRKTWCTDVWRYDLMTSSWDVATLLPSGHPRRHHSVLALDRFVYVLGGFGKYRIVQNTVDRYDTETGDWDALPNLNVPVFSAAVCACQGDIYVIKHDVEVMRRGATCWQRLAIPIPFEIGIRTAIPLGDKIYLLGTYIRKLLELDTRTLVLRELGQFQKAEGIGCLHNGRIYSILGKDANYVEYYDLRAGTFVVEAEMAHCLQNHDVLSIPKMWSCT